MKNDHLEIDVRVRGVKGDSKLKAYASVNIGSDFAVKGIRVIEGSKGLFVAMPSQKNHKGEYEDIFFPISKEGRERLQNAVLAEYQQLLKMSETPKNEIKQQAEMSM
ncbi:MAG: septation protein SpoVG family protein [Anaerotignaceae bacterium]